MDIEKVKVKLTRKQNMMIISVVCFFATLIGVSYSWIAHDFLGNSNSMVITSVGISLSYRGTSEEVLADLMPGESVSKTFSVTNYSTSDLTYNLYWNVIEDNFVNPNYLLYSLEEDTLGYVVTPRYLPTSNNKYILYFMTIPEGESHDFMLTVTYALDPVNDQSANMDKYFMGDIAISQTDQEISEIIITYVDEELVEIDSIEDLSDYTIDENRTYCTDGSSISIDNNQFSIAGITNSTNCIVYLNSVSFTPTYTDQERFNYIYFDLNGGEITTDPSGYYQEGDDIVTATPTMAGGYSFRGWQVYGNDTTATGNTVTMGTTYSHARALWSDTYTLTSSYSCADDGTSGLINAGLPTSMKYNTTVQLPTPTKTRYAFVRWDVTGTGSSIDGNNVLTMGTADTTVNAVFNRTEWTKTTKTCVSNFASYARGYKVCDRTFANYTKAQNTCNRSPWQYSKGTKSCSYNGSYWYWTGTSYSTAYSCSPNCPGTCSSTLTCTASCSVTAYAYSFGGTTTTTVSDCTNNIFDCNSGTYTQTKTACTTNYNYAFGSTQNDTQQSCTVNSFTCNSSTYQQQQTDSCTVQYNYGFESADTITSTCTVGSSFTCNSGTVNNTYVSACN